MTTEPKKNMVLLDVDDTLLFQDGYNDGLIELLVESGLIEVSLFSSMTLDPERVNQRLDLIAHMEKKGLKVESVICGSDLVFHQNEDLLKKYMSEKEKKIKDWEEQNPKVKISLDHKKEISNQLLASEDFLKLCSGTKDTQLGSAFSYAKSLNERLGSMQDNKEKITYPEILVAMNAIAEDVATFLSARENSKVIQESTKGCWYKVLSKNISENVENVFLFDDLPKVLSAVEAQHNALNPSHKLHCFKNRFPNGDAIKDSKLIFFEGVSKIVAPHLYSAYRSYQEGSIPRKTQPDENKNKLLFSFYTTLLGCKDTKEMDDCINKYKKSDEYALLAKHRNPLSKLLGKKTHAVMCFEAMCSARKKDLLGISVSHEEKREVSANPPVENKKEVSPRTISNTMSNHRV